MALSAQLGGAGMTASKLETTATISGRGNRLSRLEAVQSGNKRQRASGNIENQTFSRGILIQKAKQVQCRT